MRLILRLVTAAVVLAGGVALAAPTTTPQKTAQHFAGVPTVGALFPPGGYPSLHICTASVLRTTSGNVIMTAAHCISGTGVGYEFAPGYRNGTTPYGVWEVTAAFGAPGWVNKQDTRRDYAFLTVANRTINGKSRTIQSVTGGNRLGRTAEAHDRVKVVGYALGSNDEALRCTTNVYIHDHFPAFNCGGFPGGTSGSPWLRKTTNGMVVAGDIGGLHQGGCTPDTSYSPPLGKPAHRALGRAVHNQGANVFPAPGSDGCS